jgi:GT2 family glycosyltransferase
MTPPSHNVPRIGVVVVHYNGGPLTLDCIRSLLASRWPADRLQIVLVDNASTDGITGRVRTEFPSVQVIDSPTNLGFAGGCNLGLLHLTDVDFVALVNNDAVVDPGWLEPLVETLESDASLGAACPRILFSEQFRDVHLHSTTTRRGRGDRRDLGVRISGARIDGRDVWGSVQFVTGAWEHEHDGVDEHTFRWLGEDALLRLPDRPGRASLRLATDDAAEVTVRSGTAHSSLTVTNTPQWFDVELAAPAVDVVNNAGSVLVGGAVGADRGLYDPDGPAYLQQAEVFAWCGAGVLMPSRYLRDVGGFDERLFLYSEDFELAWRGREHGWRYAYVPQSVLRHVHMASSVDGSNLKLFYDGRNQLLVAVRHASAASVVNVLGWYVRATASRALRDVVAPLLSGRPPTTDAVVVRARALASFARMAPAMIRERARARGSDAGGVR